jgi:hypothetical protein
MVYYLHNTSRSIENRTLRSLASKRDGAVQYIDHLRFVRGRPVEVSEEFLEKNSVQIRESIALGLLELRTADGLKVGMETREVETPPAPTPLPDFKPDSIHNDKPTGRAMPIYPDGAVLSAPSAVVTAAAVVPPPTSTTSVLPPAQEEEEEEDEDVEHTDSAPQKQQSGGGKKGRR